MPLLCRYCGNSYPEAHFEIMKFVKGKLYRRKKCRACKNETRKGRQREIVLWFTEYKKDLHCNRCGLSDYRVLTFHHHDPSQKEGNISDMARRGWSLQQIKGEIAKCEVLCANCHLIEHYKEM